MAATCLAIGKLVFAAMGIAVGIRLAGTARRQGFLGLHSVALAAICAGGLGLLALALAEVWQSLPLNIAGEAAVRGGMLLLCVFISRTFRPSRAGHAGALLCSVFLVGAIVWDLLSQSQARYDYTLASSHANQLSIAIPFLWATVESALLWSRGRRQLQLGLVDGGVVRRYLLWCMATACFVGICGLAILAGLAREAGFGLTAEVAHALRGVLYLALTTAIGMGLFGASTSAAASEQSSHAER
jgi:hypothetical protein